MLKITYRGKHIANIFHRKGDEENIQIVCVDENVEVFK